MVPSIHSGTSYVLRSEQGDSVKFVKDALVLMTRAAGKAVLPLSSPARLIPTSRYTDYGILSELI